nr:hypothetical protein HmN_000840600 [Hymenolepis microstoma]
MDIVIAANDVNAKTQGDKGERQIFLKHWMWSSLGKYLVKRSALQSVNDQWLVYWETLKKKQKWSRRRTGSGGLHEEKLQDEAKQPVKFSPPSLFL